MVLKRLLIIPARKGSTRIKNKNFINFYGKPIINYSIEKAIKAKIFHTIHLSTDSYFYGKKTMKDFKIDVDFNRPKKLSNNTTGLLKVFKYVINKYKKRKMFFDQIWFISACSPLIKTSDLISASKYFNKSNCDQMLSVSKYSQPIERAFTKKNEKIFPVVPNKLKRNTQRFKRHYFHTGSFGAFKNDYFKKNSHNILGYELPIYRSVDIDNNDDLKLTKVLFKSQFL